MLFAYARVVPLPVERFDERRNPTCTALDRHEVESREAMTHAATDDLADAERVADERERGDAREARLQSHRALRERLAVAHAERRLAADVEADRHFERLRGRPDWIPMLVGERRLFEILRLAREQNGTMACRPAALDLGDRLRDIPERQRAYGSQARGIGARPLGET